MISVNVSSFLVGDISVSSTKTKEYVPSFHIFRTLMEILRFISPVAAVIGLAVLISSCVFIDEFRRAYYQLGCSSYFYSPFQPIEWCYWINMYLTAGGFGIFAGGLQIISLPFGWVKKWKIWCVIQVFVFLITLVAFSMALDKNAHKWTWKAGEKANAFIALCGIDYVFCFVSIIVILFVQRAKNSENE